MASKRAARNQGFEHFVGGKLPERALRDSRARLARMVSEHFKEAEARRKQRNKIALAAQQPLLEVVKDSPDHARTLREMKALHVARARTRRAAPDVIKQERRIYTGSMNFFFAPPFSWPWTWSATNGSGMVSGPTADQTTGAISFLSWSGNNGQGSSSAATAVGVFFRPPVEWGFMNMSSSPAFNYDWWTYNTFGWSHSDAWIGQYVGQYTLDGTFIQTVIDNRRQLWNEDHNFLASPDGTGSNSGFFMQDSTIVGSASFYECWVWCGGSSAASGSGFLSYGGGGSSLNARVPWIDISII